MKKSNGVSVHRRKKGKKMQWGESSPKEKKSNGVRVHHEKRCEFTI